MAGIAGVGCCMFMGGGFMVFVPVQPHGFAGCCMGAV